MMTGSNNSREPKPANSEDGKNAGLMRYMGLGAQFFVTIFVMLFIGWKVDRWLEFYNPVFIWVLPLLAIVATLLKIIIETNKKK